MHEKEQMYGPADGAGADALHAACYSFGGGTDSPVTVTKATYTAGTNGVKGVCEIWFEIDEAAEGNVLIDVGAEIINLLSENVWFILPSNQFKVKVHIKNSSPNAWVYQNNGMNLKTVAVEGDTLTGFIGYDGYNIELARVASIDYNHPALSALFGKTIGGNDYDLILDMYTLLAAKGYTGKDALSSYFLDYYKEKKDSSLKDWDDLVSKYRDELINTFAGGGTHVFFDVTKEWLDNASTSAMNDYIYVLGRQTSGKYQIQFKWPDEKLAAFSYNAFYQDLLTVSFGDIYIDPYKTLYRDFGVGDYLNKNKEPYIGANKYLATIGDNGQLASGAEDEFEMALTLEGPGAGNMYMGYVFSNLFNLTLQFIPATTSISVSKKWNDANDKDGIRPDNVTVQLYANGDKSGEPITLNYNGGWEYTINDLPIYSAGKEITYTVQESAVNGYTSTVTGNAADGFVITNSHEPEMNIDVPETGDPSQMMLWAALACLSLCGMAVVLHRVRKEN